MTEVTRPRWQHASAAALERALTGPGVAEHALSGNVVHTEAANAYMARAVAMRAGLPRESTACTAVTRRDRLYRICDNY